MKQKTKKPTLKQFVTNSTLVAAAVMMVIATPMHVFADTFDNQILQLQNEVNGYQSQAADLQGKAATLQGTVDQLQAQQNALLAQIQLKQAELEKLKADIIANEAKLERQKQSISKTIVQIYVNGSTTPIEMLASSKSVGDYVSEQEIRTSIRNQMKASMDEVKRLRTELDAQKVAVENNLKDQEAQRAQVASKQAEQADLLAQTQGQEAAFQSLIAGKRASIQSLRAAQSAAISAAGGNEGIVYGSSSYPWSDSSMSYDDYCNYYSGGSAADPWGYCKRQCVSYVAWKLNTDGRHNHGYSGLGNANNWGGGGSYINVNDIQPGDAVIWYIGSYGHVMYVEYVSGENVGISQMNVPYDSGRYSTKNYTKASLSSSAYEVRRFH